jgi:PAS domain S-box-containing protein
MQRLADRIRRYGVALLILGLGSLTLTVPVIGQRPATGMTVVFFVILLSAWYGGLGPGLMNTALIAILMPGSSFPLRRVVRLVLFVASGVSISVLAELLHASRRRAEESRRWLAAVLASIGDAVVVTNARGLVTFTNAVAGSLTGWAPDEAVGSPLEEVFRIVTEGTRQPVEDPVARVLRDGIVVGLGNHTLLIARDGTEIPIHDSAAPIRDGAGKLIGAVLVFRDDTERRRRERELQDSSRRKDEFLAMLAHELRNPLASMRSAADILDMPGAEDQFGWARQVIGQQIHHLSHLLDDMLDVSRITRGLIQIRPQLINASDVIHRAVATVRPLIDDRGHTLDVALTERPLVLSADPVRLEQVVVNLLTNAVRYTHAGGRIRLSADRADDQVVISVDDNGAGIAPEVLPHIFDLFTQGDRRLDRSEGGLGVGLTIVKRLVELHGGTVSVQSDGPGRGSAFTIRLPASAEAPPAATAPPAASVQSQRFRMLIVDDNRALAQGLSRLLKLLGHQVELAFDGPDAIEAARNSRPDVILLDIGLPNLDGYEVARRLRQDEELKDIVIIAISGYGHESDRQRSREAGINHHLTKPVDVKTIMELITEPDAAAPARTA